MQRTNLHKRIIITLLAVITPCIAAAQSIVKVDVDTIACLGDTVPVTIGFSPSRQIVIQDGVATLGSDSREFLPDGVICDGKCSYESPVVFTDFDPTATINSVNDILFIRLKIEHSFIGDIYMGIKCPNGQRASLMNWAGTGTSPCTDSVPTSHRGWSSDYANAGGGTFLGIAYDHTNSTLKCDSTAESNQPGTGWNYCWSDNTTHGYSYAPLDGRIYRSVNANYIDATNRAIDSSDVAAGTNFYHPDQSFGSLVGCPLNGQWSIEVVDAYSQDNGYIFEWEMALDPTLLASANSISGREVVGSQVIAHNDSTYGVTAPADASADTALPYYVYIYTTHGDTIDTMFTVHYYNHHHTYISDTLCQGDTAWWMGTPYTSDTTISVNTTTVNGCDSTIWVNYVFNPSYDLPDTLSYCPKAAFLYEGVDYGGPVQFDSPHLTVDGCDSLVHVVLNYTDSAFNLRMLVSDDGQLWSSDTALHGCRPFEIWLRDTTPLVANRQWTLGDSDTTYTSDDFTHLYDTPGSFTLTLTAVSQNGCTDTAVMANAVNVYPVPQAGFDWDNHVMVIHDAATLFVNYSQPDSIDFVWEITNAHGETDTLTGFAPNYRWASPTSLADSGDYNVTLVAIWVHEHDDTTLVCTDTVEHEIHIFNDYLEFPNLVTPNGDGNNDIWRVVNLLECGIYPSNELWIFNQWGILVYHAKDIAKEEDFWDPGRSSNPDGTYFYRFQARCPYGVVSRSGAIEVLRGE